MSDTAPTVLPPGPPLPLLAQSALMVRYGLRFLTACQRRYGDVFTLREPVKGTVVYLADPADIKTVYAGDPRVFHAGEANSILSGLLGNNSLFVLDEDVHRDRRALMVPAFHRDAVAHQAGPMAEIAAANIAGWPVGESFPVAPKLAEITLEVILRTVIGATDPTRLAALRKVMPRLLYLSPWETLAVGKPNLQRRRPWRGLRRRIAEADALLYAEIADRRADPDLAARTDMLAMLVRAGDDDGRTMTDRELRDQLMTLIAAGHETTATGLSWALERLTPPPGRTGQGGVRGRRCQRGGRSGRRRVPRRGNKGDAADPPGGVQLGPGPDRAGRGGRLPAAGRGHGGPGYRAGARERRTVPGSGPVRPGSDARRHPEPDHLVAVRRRQPPLPGRRLRHGRDAGRPA